MRKKSDLAVVHDLLVEGHSDTQGQLITGQNILTRVQEHREEDAVTIWGAEYEQVPWITGRLVVPLLCRRRDGLGLPAALAHDAWLSRAEVAEDGSTLVTQFNYSTYAWRGLGPFAPLVRDGQVSRSPAELTAGDLNAGLATSYALETSMGPARALTPPDTERLVSLLGRVHQSMPLVLLIPSPNGHPAEQQS